MKDLEMKWKNVVILRNWANVFLLPWWKQYIVVKSDLAAASESFCFNCCAPFRKGYWSDIHTQDKYIMDTTT